MTWSVEYVKGHLGLKRIPLQQSQYYLLRGKPLTIAESYFCGSIRESWCNLLQAQMMHSLGRNDSSGNSGDSVYNIVANYKQLANL